MTLPGKAQLKQGFVRIPAGTYWLGGQVDQRNPLRRVKCAGFEIAATELTNAEFGAFVAATGYRTDAERLKQAMVFEPGLAEFKWMNDSTAYWRFPNGESRGGISDKSDHPVTTISYADAEAYCRWAGVRLPTLDEWEIASRAGARTIYFWGNDIDKISAYANIWHGRDHLTADTSDGYLYTAPVGSFKPNGYGLYDMYGNVFEFCSGNLKSDPKSRKIVHSRGGSWWCSRNSCGYFNSLDIGRVNPHAAFSNQGFRVVKLNP